MQLVNTPLRALPLALLLAAACSDEPGGVPDASTGTDTGSDSDTGSDTDTGTGSDTDTGTCENLTWEGDYTIDAGADLDGLVGYATVTGNLAITADGINDIDGLECLSQVQGHLRVIEAANLLDLPDYTACLFEALRQLEAAGNTVYPSLSEARWWENKAFMYARFSELGVPHPETRIVRRGDPLPECRFPAVLKEVHSASSRGVFKLSAREELEAHAGRIFGAGQEAFALQKLLDIRRDLRVILAGDRVVSHYWRLNLSGEWRPTSTDRGSAVDFGNFPERWRGFIIENFLKLGLRTGAFDVAWEKDDLSAPPVFLEVSPHYQPNPAPSLGCASLPYFEYKKCLFVRDPYYARYVDLVFELKRAVYGIYFDGDGGKKG